jgi:hypothetical protein
MLLKVFFRKPVLNLAGLWANTVPLFVWFVWLVDIPHRLD